MTSCLKAFRIFAADPEELSFSLSVGWLGPERLLDDLSWISSHRSCSDDRASNSFGGGLVGDLALPIA
jgi:hypothetical protein